MGSNCKEECNIQNIYVPCFNWARCFTCGRHWEDGEEIDTSTTLSDRSDNIERPIQEYEKDTDNLC